MGYYDDYLEHHGVKGQKWGVRRFQNPDGSLKPAGQKRYFNETRKIVGKTKPYESYKVNSSKEKRNKATEMMKRAISDKDREELKTLSEESRKAHTSIKGSHSKKADEAWAKVSSKRKEIVRNVLGDYGNKKLNTFSIDDTAYRDVLNSLVKWDEIEN